MLIMITIIAPVAKKIGDLVNPKIDISVATISRKTRSNTIRHELIVGIRIIFSISIPAVDTLENINVSARNNLITRTCSHLHFLSVLINNGINIR